MAIPSYNLFQLEDGGRLSIAVHSEVPQYEYLCYEIDTHRGTVIDDESKADFCLVSLLSIGVDEIVEGLRTQGKCAVHDYWIRDSVHAERLLPWYSYEILPSNLASMNATKTISKLSVKETEERDVYELAAIAARYWPIFSHEELHRRASRRCPHRSITEFCQLHEAHKAEVESRVTSLRCRLGDALAFNGEFNRKPNMSFGSPTKRALQLQAISSEPTAARSMPTVARASQNPFSRRVGSAMEARASARPDEQEPYDPPNMDSSVLPSPSPSPPRKPLPPKPSKNDVGNKSAMERISNRKKSPVRKPGIVSVSRVSDPISGRGGRPVTEEDKYEFAKFLAEQPSGEGRVGWLALFKEFHQKNPRGRLRSAKAWKHAYARYKDDIESLKSTIQKKNSLKRPEATEATSNSPSAPKALALMSAGGSTTKTTASNAKKSSRVQKDAKEKVTSTAVTRTKSQSGRSAIITDEEKKMLAEWMLENPRLPQMKKTSYFANFEKQYKGPARREGAWEKAASNYKDYIAEIQRKILQQRGGKTSSAHGKRISLNLGEESDERSYEGSSTDTE